jgi:DNA processing protein
MAVVDNLGTPAPTPEKPEMLPPQKPCPWSHVLRLEAGYPQALVRLGRPPAELWYRGVLPGAGARAREGTGVGMVGDTGVVAIVGARAASGAGCERARTLARALGGAGYAVISGGAHGIDAAAHMGALDAGAATFAVLGCGIDIVYPDRHGPLFDRIAAAGGGVLSEYPPGTQPRPGQFPARNRIIAALADVVVVVEAARRSGALSTAAHAVALGVPVLATGGSAGADALLRAGKAGREDGVASVERALCGEALAAPAVTLPTGVPFAAVVRALAAAPEGCASAESLAARLGLPLRQVLGRLSEAELDGWVRRAPGGFYEVTGAH